MRGQARSFPVLRGRANRSESRLPRRRWGPAIVVAVAGLAGWSGVATYGLIDTAQKVGSQEIALAAARQERATQAKALISTHEALSALTQQQQALSDRLGRQSQSLSRLAEEKRAAGRALRERAREMAQLRSERDGLARSRWSLVQDTAELEQANATLAAAHDRAQRKLAWLRRQVDDGRADRARLVDDRDVLQAEVAALTERLTDLNVAHETVFGERDNLRRDNCGKCVLVLLIGDVEDLAYAVQRCCLPPCSSSRRPCRSGRPADRRAAI